jgi:hypothetical protein
MYKLYHANPNQWNCYLFLYIYIYYIFYIIFFYIKLIINNCMVLYVMHVTELNNARNRNRH